MPDGRLLDPLVCIPGLECDQSVRLYQEMAEDVHLSCMSAGEVIDEVPTNVGIPVLLVDALVLEVSFHTLKVPGCCSFLLHHDHGT